jgi:hypothetical protein
MHDGARATARKEEAPRRASDRNLGCTVPGGRVCGARAGAGAGGFLPVTRRTRSGASVGGAGCRP